MTKKILQRDDVWNFVVGAAVLATGGGGITPSQKRIAKSWDRILEKGYKISVIDREDVPDNSIVFMKSGGGGGVEADIKKRYMAYPSYEDLFLRGFDQIEFVKIQIQSQTSRSTLNSWSEIPDRSWSAAAQKRLESLLNAKPFAYAFFETGPGNGFNSMLDCAEKDLALINGDFTGYRAVPEASLCSLNVMDAPIPPAVFTTCWGDQLVLEKVLNWQRYEDICRFMATISGGALSGMVSFVGNVVKKAMAPAAIDKSIELGKRVNEARKQGEDPISAIRKCIGASLLFKGKILARIMEEKSSHTWGETHIVGTDEFSNQTFRIWFKNENIICWRDQRPLVTVPDSIIVVDSETGAGLSNFWAADFETSRNVTVLGMRSWNLWQTKRGLEVFSPRHFGFDMDYLPCP